MADRQSIEGLTGAMSGEPLYKYVERKILEQLSVGGWRPGDQLPTEKELAERLGVAVFTVRAGIASLVASKVLVRRQGKGTFVALHRDHHKRFHFFSFFRTDGEPFQPTRTLLAFKRRKPTAEARHLFNHARRHPLDATIWVQVALSEERTRGAFFESELPADLFANLTSAAIEGASEADNLYGTYQDVCGVTVVGICEEIMASASTEKTERILGIPQGEPVLHVNRTAYTFNGVPVEIRHLFFDAKRYHYEQKRGLHLE